MQLITLESCDLRSVGRDRDFSADLFLSEADLGFSVLVRSDDFVFSKVDPLLPPSRVPELFF